MGCTDSLYASKYREAMQNKINPQDLNYINVPLSIIEQRWYKSEAAVRAFIFMACQARISGGKIKTVKARAFKLSEGELICTRTYLSEALKITDVTAKGQIDRLKRGKAISVKQEILSKDQDIKTNRLSRIKVNGVPVPNEPYIKMYYPQAAEVMWETPVLAQLYIYMMVKAAHKPCYIYGSRGKAVLLQPGDVVIKRSDVLEALRCKEWLYKATLKKLEDAGAISKKDKIGNSGLLLHLTYYPVHKDNKVQKPNQEEVKPTAPVVAAAPAGNVSVPISPVTPQTPSAAPAIQAQVLQTPVTDAIKYLYIDLKHNKDIDRLNQIIRHIAGVIPADYPIDHLRDAMDYYYAEHGSKYIDEQALEQSITRYCTIIRRDQAAASARAAEIKALQQQLADLDKVPTNCNDNWQDLIDAYKVYQSEGNLNRYDRSLIMSLSHVVHRANALDAGAGGRYVSISTAGLVSCPNIYVEDFFRQIPSVDKLVEICNAEQARQQQQLLQQRNNLEAKLTILQDS